MGIQAAFEAMTAKLDAALAFEGADAAPSYGIGEAALVAADSPPRIVWVPTIGNHARARGESGLSNPGPLWTRSLRVEAHVWADDVDAVERLAGHMIAAMQDAGIAHVMLDEAWDTKGVSDNGMVGIFAFQLKLTFAREPLSEVLADTPVIAGEIQEQVVS
jgi:hypothetical protein